MGDILTTFLGVLSAITPLNIHTKPRPRVSVTPPRMEIVHVRPSQIRFGGASPETTPLVASLPQTAETS